MDQHTNRPLPEYHPVSPVAVAPTIEVANPRADLKPELHRGRPIRRRLRRAKRIALAAAIAAAAFIVIVGSALIFIPA